MQNEKESIRHAIIKSISTAHTFSPKLSGCLVDAVERDLVPALVASTVPPYFDRPMHERSILANLLVAIVSPSLPIEQYLTRLVLLAHHPFFGTPQVSANLLSK